MLAMIFYYRFFHSKGPITWKNSQDDVELNNKATPHTNKNKSNGLNHIRSFKTSNKVAETTRYFFIQFWYKTNIIKLTKYPFLFAEMIAYQVINNYHKMIVIMQTKSSY